MPSGNIPDHVGPLEEGISLSAPAEYPVSNELQSVVTGAIFDAQLGAVPGLHSRVLRLLSGNIMISSETDISISPGVDDRGRAGYAITFADDKLDCPTMGPMMCFLREHPTRIVPLLKQRKERFFDGKR